MGVPVIVATGNSPVAISSQPFLYPALAGGKSCLCSSDWQQSALGDRLTAGLRTLDPSIGVRIPVPQPVVSGQGIYRISCQLLARSIHGGRSSAVERQIVALNVVGSIPTGRPTNARGLS
jgi:hypothetical protein